MDQTVPLLLVENNYKAFVTIGPKFHAQEATVGQIVADYRRALNRQTKDGWLSPASKYMQEAGQWKAVTGRRVPIKFRATPKTSLENEIGVAMKIALGVPE